MTFLFSSIKKWISRFKMIESKGLIIILLVLIFFIGLDFITRTVDKKQPENESEYLFTDENNCRVYRFWRGGYIYYIVCQKPASLLLAPNYRNQKGVINSLFF